MKRRWSKLRVLMAVVVGVMAGQAHADGGYAVFNELPLPAGQSNLVVGGLNNLGQVVGSVSSSTGTPLAAVWQGSSASVLPSNGSTYHRANDINDAGQAVGVATYGDQSHATLWTGTTVTDLQGLAGYTRSEASAINASGQAVGYSDSFENYKEHATVWTHGVAAYLGNLTGNPDDWSYARDINDHGQAVGFSSGIGNWQATLWYGGSATALDNLPGGWESYAHAINNAGQAVGVAITSADNLFHAVLWDGTSTPTQLSDKSGFAKDINSIGQIVGNADVGGAFHGVLWQDGHMTDLTDFLDPSLRAQGWFVSDAYSINDSGQILASLATSSVSSGRAVLITSVPEPGTWAMMLLGLAGLGLAVRRRVVA